MLLPPPPPPPLDEMLVHSSVTPSIISQLPVHTPGWREMTWSNDSCLKKIISMMAETMPRTINLQVQSANHYLYNAVPPQSPLKYMYREIIETLCIIEIATV